MALYSGNYSVLISDGNGCTNTLNFTIDEPTGITYIIDSFPTSCFGYSDGSVTLTIFGGSPPYIQDWGSQNPLSLSAGNHTFTITDNNNCIDSFSNLVNNLNGPTLSFNKTDITCSGYNDGQATANLSGGTSPYQYSWDNGDTSQSVSSLDKGTYFLSIEDQNGCITIAKEGAISLFFLIWIRL